MLTGVVSLASARRRNRLSPRLAQRSPSETDVSNSRYVLLVRVALPTNRQKHGAVPQIDAKTAGFFALDTRPHGLRVCNEAGMAQHSGKFVAYYRVSTGKQGKSGLGIEAQREAVKAYLNGGDWAIVAEFTEVESGKRSDRPALEQALTAARLHRASLVVSKVDRLTRSVAFLSRLLEVGVDVRFADLPAIEGATGRFLLQQMITVAELEAGMISDRTKKALAAAKRRGKVLGGNRGVTPGRKMQEASRKSLQARSAARAAEISHRLSKPCRNLALRR
jgi:DNA invertase Pin-like site-specific DNA recombinase